MIPASFNEEANTIDVVFATEVSVLRRDWEETYQEILVCQTANVRLHRLNAGGAVIDTHDTSTIKNQFGVVVRAWIDDQAKEARATLRLSQNPDWKGVVDDIRTGIIKNISVGYLIYAFDVDDSIPNVPPTYRAVDWEPTEISFCPVPIDYMSGTRGDTTAENIVTINFKTDKNKMTEKQRAAAILAAVRAAGLSIEYAELLIESEKTLDEARAEISAKRSAAQTDPAQIRAQERARISGIRTAARVAGVADDFVTGLIDSDTNLDQARAQIIDEAARLNPVLPAMSRGISVGADEKDKKTRGMENALLQRAGAVSSEVAGDPGQFRGMTLMDLAKECLEMAGMNVRGMERREVAIRALSMGARDAGGGMSSGDFSYILQNVLNKTLRTMYALQERTFTPWTRKSTATDFKTILRTQLSDVKLLAVGEGAEYKQAQFSDFGESYKVAKYGRLVTIDWEAIINDDLDAFSRVPGLLAAAVAQIQSDVVYNILVNNPTMGDNVALFNAAKHFNLAGAGSDITIASLSAARQAIRTQKSPGGSQLNLRPKFLICGPAKETVAIQMLSANMTANVSGNINVFSGSMVPVIEGRITDNSWFLSADPGVIDTVEYATLDGQDIYTEARYGFEVDGLQWKIRTVFGAKALEWRSLYKNPGA